MSNQFEVLSPRGDVDPLKQIAPTPRLTDLNKATIGLYTTFKEHWELILEEIAKQLKERYPGIEFTRFVYPEDLNSYTQAAELAKDPRYRPQFEEWIKGVDGVIVANADAGSCTLYLTYNATFPEHLGKPTVLTVASEFVDLLKRAAELRGIPALRWTKLQLLDIAMEPDFQRFIDVVIPERVSEALDGIIAGLTEPLTPEEAAVPASPDNTPRVAMKGTLEEIYHSFYKQGWMYGMPIMPPTEEAVQEMLTGTDLPPDHVVAKIPPLMGKATVEKIAVNAVMAGCLPPHLPVVIAGVEALADPHMWVEAYTCSVASWAPLLMVNGPVRKDLDLTVGPALLSPYKRGNAAIAHALGLIIMNIAGIKAGREDMALFGHEGRFGMCIAENEEESPWEPMHVYYGLAKDDSAVTISWPNTRYFGMYQEDLGAILRAICDGIPAFGFDPGCTIIMSPDLAKFLHARGMSRKDLVDYIVEYARIPTGGLVLRWMTGNHHEPKGVPLPQDPTRSVRKFWSGMHLPIIVAGGNGIALMFYGGGGDHGGPITKKVRLPQNWGELVMRYRD
jgi:hypothetical protein